MAPKLKQERMEDVYQMTGNLLAKQAEVLALVRALSEMKRHPARSLRPFECTQKEFDLLPGLVARSVFLYWTGLNDKDLSQEVKAKRIDVYKPNPNSKGMYYKRDIARMTGFKL